MKVLLALVLAGCAFAATIAEKTAGSTKLPGFFSIYWDEKTGRLWLEIERFNSDFLYVNSLPAGIGSNDLGLDRGKIGGNRVVRFERSGPKILLVEPNLRFRAVSRDADERKAVEDSFARSVLWGFDVQAEEGSRVLVDATPFFLRDAEDVGAVLERAKQGVYRLDATRSAIYLDRTKSFPKNTEVEATITLTGGPGGGFVRQVTPAPAAISVREHHSFIELPDGGYEPRAFDPRAGYFDFGYVDYAVPVGVPAMQRFIERHRLKKKDASAAIGEPVKPIVYYLDRGAPEPIRSALLDGARWWNQAFEAAGYKDAFRVELLPEGADPMDIRYNLIQWVHRSTRGWSYGATIADPRTGEIIKGQVTLGSLRVRQDYMIAEGLLAPYADGVPAEDPMLKMSVARLRQLAAHEVGHTLGLAHNFASSVNGRASVMDYPHPLVKLDAAGKPDLADAYGAGIAEWDKITINYGYRDYPAGTDRAKAGDKLLRDATARGLLFISDEGSRPEGSLHPQAHLWDNGADAAQELQRLLDVRTRVLARFGENNVRPGAPMSHLEDLLVPMFLLHRYQTEAAAKVVGGAYYSYAARGDGQRVNEVVPAEQQRRALDALLRTIKPDELALPERLLKLIPPTAFGYTRTNEDFRSHAGLAFDPLGAAESAADLTVRLILNPERAARLIQQHALDPKIDGLSEVIGRLVGATWDASPLPGMRGEVQRTVNGVVLYHLMALAADASAAEPVRAIAFSKLTALRASLGGRHTKDAMAELAIARIRKFELDPKEVTVAKPVEAPPGQPIGCDWDR